MRLRHHTSPALAARGALATAPVTNAAPPCRTADQHHRGANLAGARSCYHELAHRLRQGCKGHPARSASGDDKAGGNDIAYAWSLTERAPTTTSAHRLFDRDPRLFRIAHGTAMGISTRCLKA